jgi:hypothetical protein
MGRYLQVLLPILACALAAPVAAESATYRVKFRFDGATGFYLFDPPACPGTSRTGFDEFEGELKGDESEFATKQRVVYTGVMKRRTEIDACDLLPEDADGIANYCNVHLVGGGEFFVELTVHHQRTEVYFQARPRKGKVSYQANGSCEREIVVNYKQSFEKGVGFEHWIGPRSYSERDNVGGPPRAGTYRDQPPFPPHLAGHWTMTVGPRDELRADAGGPYTIGRGVRVTLDGSRSRPASGHQIVDYSWELTPLGTPEGCAGIGQPTTLSGATVTFVALCSVQAKLTVRQDDQQEDFDDVEATVKARAWRTDFTTEKTVKCDKSFNFIGGPQLMSSFVFGYNRCSRAGHFTESERANHWYEPRGGSTSDFEDGTYWLDVVADDGPFADVSYVSRGDFEIRRARWVNRKLCKDGSVWLRNQRAPSTVEGWPSRAPECKFGKAQMARLLRSIERHEQLHSDLAEAALRKLKDPAIDVEQSLGTDRTRLKDRVNLFVSTAVSDMINASDEDRVKAEMRAMTEFDDGACFDFPDWDGELAADGCYFEFSSLADKVQ